MALAAATRPLVQMSLLARALCREVHVCRSVQAKPLKTYACTGGLLATEAIALLRQFYAAGNPNGNKECPANPGLASVLSCTCCLSGCLRDMCTC